MRLQHRSLLDLPGIEHGFFTRNGGASSGIYQSLNCGFGSDDDKEHVAENRALIAKTMGVASDKLITAHQVHSPDALAVTSGFADGQAPKLDALVTATPGLAVAILTADCGPILFADPEAKVVAAAHSGWRGAFSGVIETTIERMEELGARASNIIAVLGPTISKPNYEVDTAFMDNFTNTKPEWEQFFSEGNRQGHVQFDLPAFILHKLNSCGLALAINMDRCTYGEEDLLFSFRRSTHRNEPDYGRQISAIALT